MKVLVAAVSVGLIVAVSGGAMAKTNTVTLRDRQQAACYGDVQKLCGDALPDEAKVEACMKPKKSQVSAKCAAMWDVTE